MGIKSLKLHNELISSRKIGYVDFDEMIEGISKMKLNKQNVYNETFGRGRKLPTSKISIMKIVHLVLSNSFAGIEQHVDELLANNLLEKPILICTPIAEDFDKNIVTYKIKNIGRRSIFGKKSLEIIKNINPDIVHTHAVKQLP